jgi:hypothetical protein
MDRLCLLARRRAGRSRPGRRDGQRLAAAPAHRRRHYKLALVVVCFRQPGPDRRGCARLRPRGGVRRPATAHASRHRRGPGRICRPAPRRPVGGAGCDTGQQDDRTALHGATGQLDPGLRYRCSGVLPPSQPVLATTAHPARRPARGRDGSGGIGLARDPDTCRLSDAMISSRRGRRDVTAGLSSGPQRAKRTVRCAPVARISHDDRRT